MLCVDIEYKNVLFDFCRVGFIGYGLRLWICRIVTRYMYISIYVEVEYLSEMKEIDFESSC